MSITKSRRTQIRRRRRLGQGMTEYIVLVGLIAILLIGAVTKFKNSLESAFNKSTDAINNNIVNPIDAANKAGPAPAPTPKPN